MLYLVQSQMRNSRKYPLLNLLRKHGPFSKQPMKKPRLSRIQSFKDIMNSSFNLGKTILEPKIVRKVLRSLLERFHVKITVIEESKDIDKIPLTELAGNL